MTYTPFKRLLDIIVALTLSLVFLPVWILVPFLIVLSSPGPILYRHKRVGKFGQP